MERLRGEAWINSPKKRAEDLLLAAGFFPVAGPPAAIAAFAVRLVDKEKPLFKQKRVGKGGVLFTAYKLRTMPGVRDDRPSGGKADHEDASKIGTYLRALRLDEFPQLANVVKGEMSVIAPRAILSADYDVARKVLGPRTYRKWVDLRELSRPGIFDLYGIEVHSGNVPEDDLRDQFLTRVDCDTQMIEEASFGQDMAIITEVSKMLARAFKERVTKHAA